MFGETWGEQNPSPEDPEPWTTWVFKETTTEARNTGSWGILQLASGESMVSSVRDFGSSAARHLRITWDDYDPGTGTFTLYWRGQNTTFDKDDDEITGPTWVAYPTGGQNKSWRYAQIMAVG
ncbi:unnamed protein product [marine sediment metagenome]|uniref:Uncharacterized protein n=1 Tax=marine sediment metagenome TaxID=412755 RepID=X0UWI9_9ZZZZ